MKKIAAIVSICISAVLAVSAGHDLLRLRADYTGWYHDHFPMDIMSGDEERVHHDELVGIFAVAFLVTGLALFPKK